MTPDELNKIGQECVIFLKTLLNTNVKIWYVTEFLIQSDFVMFIRITGFTPSHTSDIDNIYETFDYVFGLQDYASKLLKVTRLIAIKKDENIFSCH